VASVSLRLGVPLPSGVSLPSGVLRSDPSLEASPASPRIASRVIVAVRGHAEKNPWSRTEATDRGGG